MKSNNVKNSKALATGNAPERVTIDLKYLTADQARQLINMFDSPEAYAENFSAIKAITRGLYKVIEETKPTSASQIGRMFKTVNTLQSTLLLDNMQEVERIISSSGLMPDPWYRFRSQRKSGTV